MLYIYFVFRKTQEVISWLWKKIILATVANTVRTPAIAVGLDVFNKLSQIFSTRRSSIVRTDAVDDGLIDGTFLNKIRSCYWFNKSQDAITETIRSWMIYFRPCDPDRTIAFHKRRARSVYQIHKIRNQVHCCLNHDMNRPLLSLKPTEIARSELHAKRQTDDVYLRGLNGRRGEVLCATWYESIPTNEVRYNPFWKRWHVWQVCICSELRWMYTSS